MCLNRKAMMFVARYGIGPIRLSQLQTQMLDPAIWPDRQQANSQMAKEYEMQLTPPYQLPHKTLEVLIEQIYRGTLDWQQATFWIHPSYNLPLIRGKDDGYPANCYYDLGYTDCTTECREQISKELVRLHSCDRGYDSQEIKLSSLWLELPPVDES